MRRYFDESNPPEEGYIRCYCGQWAISYHTDCRALRGIPLATEKDFDEEDPEFDPIGCNQ